MRIAMIGTGYVGLVSGEFRALDFARAEVARKTPLMADLRNIYRPAQMAEYGFRYVSVGRP